MNPELMRVTLSCTHLQQARVYKQKKLLQMTQQRLSWSLIRLAPFPAGNAIASHRDPQLTPESRERSHHLPLGAGSGGVKVRVGKLSDDISLLYLVGQWHRLACVCRRLLMCRRRVVGPVCPLSAAAAAAAARTASEERWLLRCGASGSEG